MDEIKNAYADDIILQNVITSITTNNWKSSSRDELRQFYLVRNELTYTHEILLRNRKLVIPCSLRHRILSLAHEGHMGIVKCKARLRSKVWWPGIDKDTEQYISTCHSCQLNSVPNNPSPLQMTDLPDKAWFTLGIDLCGPFPSGETLLVVVDYYSRFPFVEIMHTVTARAIINRLFRIFSVHGLPDNITTDNGGQFISAEFKLFLQINGIKHRRVAPLWPQANGQVERTAPRWYPKPFVVVSIKGTAVVVREKDGEATYMRNISHLKKYLIRNENDDTFPFCDVVSNGVTEELLDSTLSPRVNVTPSELRRSVRAREPPTWYGDVVTH